ncbi:MAG: class D sortase [Oscillospiraceae bacterium]|nr:class D sortase [Oscillospiraceae bacterium]
MLFQKQIQKSTSMQITTYKNALENQMHDNGTELIEDITSQPIKKSIESFKTNNIVGMLIIPKIGLEQEVKEGIDMPTLWNYIGHFPTTSVQNGNIGLAAHNRGYKNNYFANIYKLKIGDEIIYKSKYGTKKYTVKISKEISDEDWSYLQKTKDNRVTLITCISNKPNKRLCVQAIEETI